MMKGSLKVNLEATVGIKEAGEEDEFSKDLFSVKRGKASFGSNNIVGNREEDKENDPRNLSFAPSENRFGDRLSVIE